MDNTYNIFTTERRIDIVKECGRIIDLCKESKFIYPIKHVSFDMYDYIGNEEFYYDEYFEDNTYSLIAIFDYAILHWNYRITAASFSQYLSDIGAIDFSLNKNAESKAMLTLATIVNLISWSDKFIEILFADLPDSIIHTTQVLYRKSIKVINENITTVLEQINYKISDYGEDRKIFTKRDEDVDSVLGIDIKLDQYLLGYLDIQNQDNIQFKKQALKTLADHLEPHKSEFKETAMSSYYDTFAFAVNNMNIRHNNKSQINLGGSEKEVYDKIFRIGIHLIRELNVREIKKEIDQYKPK